MGITLGPTLVSCAQSADFGQCFSQAMSGETAPVTASTPLTAPDVDPAPQETAAAITQEPAAPVQQVAEAGEEPASAPEATPVPPSVDLVRVEPDGSALIAGNASGGALVEIHANDALIGDETSDAGGDWVYVTEAPLPTGGVDLRILDTQTGLYASTAIVVVIAEDRTSEPLVVAANEGEPTEILQGLARPEPAEPPAEDVAEAPEPLAGDVSAQPEQTIVDVAESPEQIAPAPTEPVAGSPEPAIEAAEPAPAEEVPAQIAAVRGVLDEEPAVPAEPEVAPQLAEFAPEEAELPQGAEDIVAETEETQPVTQPEPAAQPEREPTPAPAAPVAAETPEATDAPVTEEPVIEPEPTNDPAAQEPAAIAPEPEAEPAPAAPPAVTEEPVTPEAPAAEPAAQPAPEIQPEPAEPGAQPESEVQPAPETQVALAPAGDPAPWPAAPEPAIAIVPPTIDAIEVDGERNFFAGAGPEGFTVRLYVDNAFVADAPVGDGRWLVESGNVLVSESQRVRADLIDENGQVVARAEVNFVLDLPEPELSPEPETPATVVADAEPLVEEPSEPETPAQPVEDAPVAETPVAVAEAEAPAPGAPELRDSAAQSEPEVTAEPQAPAASEAPEVQTTQPETPRPQPVEAPEAEPVHPTPVIPAQPEEAEPLAETVAPTPPAEEPAPAPEAEPMPAPAGDQPEADIPTLVGVQDGDRVVTGRAIIRTGDNLWTIARRVYGAGIRYTQIYQANAGQIRDPDLIYPGQVFDLPETDMVIGAEAGQGVEEEAAAQ